MKIDRKRLKCLGTEPAPAVHNVRVDLYRMGKLGLYQMPHGPVKVDRETLKRLESVPMPAGPAVKVDLARLEELGLYQRPVDGPASRPWYRTVRLPGKFRQLIQRPRICFRVPEAGWRRKLAYVMAGAAVCASMGFGFLFFGSAGTGPSAGDIALLEYEETPYEDIAVTHLDDRAAAEAWANAVPETDAREDAAAEDEPASGETSMSEETREEESQDAAPAETESVQEGDEMPLLATANVETSLDVRVDASEDSEQAGLLYKDCSGMVLEQKDGWTKLESGNLVGWASDEYLVFSDEAPGLADEAGLVATVNAFSLHVREESSADSAVLGYVSEGDMLNVIEIGDGWAEVEYKDSTGHISMNWADISPQTGETMEEIQARGAKMTAPKKEAAKQAAAEWKKPEETPEQAVEVPVEVQEQPSVESFVDDAAEASVEAAAEPGQGISISDEHLNMLAAIIYCEAGNQPYDGQVAVGAVVVNRYLSPEFPDNIPDILRAKKQFQPVGSGKFDRVYSAGSWSESSMSAAREAVLGAKGGVGGALYFKNPKKAGAHAGITIGDHVFW